jgi:hypothetical protein
MNFIIWLLVGGFIGWLASMLMKTNDQQGVVLNIVGDLGRRHEASHSHSYLGGHQRAVGERAVPC